MNAHNVRALNAAIVDELADRHRNWDSLSRDHAVSRLGCRQPAFWHNASSTNAVVGELCSRANQYGSIDEAQETLIDDVGATGCGHNYRSWEFLDRLIPLNLAAVRDLDAAYRRAGTFREAIEIGRACGETVRLPAATVVGAINLLDAARAVRVA